MEKVNLDLLFLSCLFCRSPLLTPSSIYLYFGRRRKSETGAWLDAAVDLVFSPYASISLRLRQTGGKTERVIIFSGRRKIKGEKEARFIVCTRRRFLTHVKGNIAEISLSVQFPAKGETYQDFVWRSVHARQNVDCFSREIAS